MPVTREYVTFYAVPYRTAIKMENNGTVNWKKSQRVGVHNSRFITFI